MSRFFFHLIDSIGTTADTEGCALPGDDAALAQARRCVRGMIAEEVRETGDIRLDRAIDIVRADGTGAGHIQFTDAVSLRYSAGEEAMQQMLGRQRLVQVNDVEDSTG